MPRLDITGHAYAYLTAIEYSHSLNGKAYWRFKCKCGETTTLLISNVRNGHTSSCGCHRREISGKTNLRHGATSGNVDRLYRTWATMKQRCNLTTSESYPDYGGRGIRICREWSDDYVVFRDWALANGYSDELTIDREDNDGNYEPGNCRWTTYTVQNNNRRNTRIVNYLGMDMTMSEFVDSTGMSVTTLQRRLDQGMSPELAANKSVRGKD